jgi:hypothetical protein
MATLPIVIVLNGVVEMGQNTGSEQQEEHSGGVEPVNDEFH